MNNFFDELFNEIVFNEGGYANDKDDNGGETYLGITRKNHPNAKMWDIIDLNKKAYGLTGIDKRLKGIKEITDEAKQIYLKGYWNVCRLSELNSKKLCYQIFDEAVNAGTPLAIKLAYELVNMQPDTKMTDVVVNKLKAYGEERI